jgi:hypothetical protein
LSIRNVITNGVLLEYLLLNGGGVLECEVCALGKQFKIGPSHRSSLVDDFV